MIEPSQHFNGERFLRWVCSWKEGPRLDFKAKVASLADEARKFEFAKDVLAFANVARRTGKPCWIVFGVEKNEKGQRKVLDVKDQYPGKPPKGWNNPEASVTELQADGVEMHYRNVARDWIEPEPDLQLEYGEVESKFVSFVTTQALPISRIRRDKSLPQFMKVH